MSTCGTNDTSIDTCQTIQVGDANIVKGTTGNGKTSNTYFSGGESPGLGACGGCGAIKDAGGQGCVTEGDFKHMADALLGVKASCDPDDGCIGWLATAPAEAMASQYCATGSNCGLGTDAKAANGPTASAPCGSSFKLYFENGKYANLVVADACPNLSNERWCRKTPSDPTNDAGQYNHFDIWVGNQDTTGKQIVDNLGVSELGYLNHLDGGRTFEAIETPDEVIQVLQNYCCGTWYYNQGCPSICGDKFHYGDGKPLSPPAGPTPTPSGPTPGPSTTGCCMFTGCKSSTDWCNSSQSNCEGNCKGTFKDPCPPNTATCPPNPSSMDANLDKELDVLACGGR